jgi:hypothetical protein
MIPMTKLNMYGQILNITTKGTAFVTLQSRREANSRPHSYYALLIIKSLFVCNVRNACDTKIVSIFVTREILRTSVLETRCNKIFNTGIAAYVPLTDEFLLKINIFPVFPSLMISLCFTALA